MSEQQTNVTTDEMAAVVCGRRREALDAGLSWDDAEDYCDNPEAKTEDLRHLIEIHCPARLLARILL